MKLNRLFRKFKLWFLARFFPSRIIDYAMMELSRCRQVGREACWTEGRYTVGVDWGRGKDSSYALLMEKRDDGTIVVLEEKIFPER